MVFSREGLERVNRCGQNLEGASADLPPRPARACILEPNVQGGDKRPDSRLHMTPSSACHVKDAASHKLVMGIVVVVVCEFKFDNVILLKSFGR